MSAAEKLRELNKEMTDAPWESEPDTHGQGDYEVFVKNSDFGFLYAFKKEDGNALTLLRNALPELIAVVEAADATIDQTSVIYPAGGLDPLEEALEALNTKLGKK